MTTCHECRAVLPSGGTCKDHFYALLCLEHQLLADQAAVADGRGESAHFYAVSSYILQHPEGMEYRADVLAKLRRQVAEHLNGQIGIEAMRQKVRLAADGPTRILRRKDDPIPSWPINQWPMTIADVLQGGVEGYLENVRAWATSVIETLDAAGA